MVKTLGTRLRESATRARPISKSRFALTEHVLVEYAVEVEVAAHGAAVAREVVAEVALEVIFHVAENVGLEVPEVKVN